jgi:hypothetical protein
VNPEHTYAVVVGIEKYELTGSDLNGPGEDAVRFVEWLRKNDVPAANIFLFLSPLAENQAALQSRLESPEVGVSQKPAGRSQIEACLRGLADAKGELLYLFWGGHGIADELDNRYLFYADTTDSTLNHHLDVPTWLGQLASYAHLPAQIGYIDACANLKPQWKMGVNKLPARARNAVQSVFFAAAIGQRAANDDIERSGKFSQTLRAVFAEVQTQDPSWPPPPRRVIEALREKFRGDRTQMPVFYEAGDFDGTRWRDGDLPASEFVEAVARDSGYAVRDLRMWAEESSRSQKLMAHPARDSVLRWLERKAAKSSGELGQILGDGVEDWLRTFAIAIRLGLLAPLQDFIDALDVYARPLSQKMRTARELNQLDQLLEKTQLKRAELHQAYLLTTEKLGSGVSRPQNRRDMLRTLPLSAEDSLRHIAEFVLRLNEKVNARELRDWVDAHVRQSTVAEIETKLQVEAANHTYYLFFWIKNGQITGVLFRGKGFEFVKKWPQTEFQPGALDELVDRYLAEAEKYSQNLSVQFLVSREYFAWSPQAVLVRSELGDSSPLGGTYPTVMRWRERALGLPRTRHKEWAERAELVLKHAETRLGLSCGWIAEDLDAQKLRMLLNAVGTDHQIVAFDFSPPRTVKAGSSSLTDTILDGVPVILWPCDEPPDRSAIRKALSERAEQSDLKHLTDSMKDFYATDCGKWRVTLFWDDPENKPERWEYADDF